MLYEKVFKGKSQEYQEALNAYLPNGNYCSRNPKQRIYFSHGDKSRIYDIDGNVYLDLHMRYGACMIGHNNAYYLEKMNNCIDQVMAIESTDLILPVCKKLVQNIYDTDFVRFSLSGSEAVRNAVRLARAHTGRKRILRFLGEYHGIDDSLYGGVIYDVDIPVPYDDMGTFTGTLGRGKGILENQCLMIHYNDIHILENTISTYYKDIAAIILDPCCVHCGGAAAIAGFLETLRFLCDKYGIVLIFDEIASGFWLGLSGAKDYVKVAPDICLLGASISGGVPCSLIACKKQFKRLFTDHLVIHGGTFNGYPLSIAGIQTTIQLMENPNLQYYVHMKNAAQKIHDIFLREAQKLDLDLVIQGPALCASFHCSKKPVNQPIIFDKRSEIIAECMTAHGIIVCPPSIMYINATINDDDIEFFEEHITPALRDAKEIIESLREVKLV